MFISVPQARICRYSSKTTSNKIVGLYTDNFSICNIVVFVSAHKNEIRISMTHVDFYFDVNKLLDEHLWVSHDGTAGVVDTVIFHKKSVLHSSTGTFLSSIYNSIRSTFMKTTTVAIDDCFGISVQVEGEDLVPTYYPNGDIPLLSCHPKEYKASAYYRLNRIKVMQEMKVGRLSSEEPEKVREWLEENDPQQYTTLFYNGGKWMSLSEHDESFTEHTGKIFKKMDIRKKDTRECCLGKIRAAMDVRTDEIRSYEKCILQIIHENNYSKILEVNMKSMFSRFSEKETREIIKSFSEKDLLGDFKKYLRTNDKGEVWDNNKQLFDTCYRMKQHTDKRQHGCYKGSSDLLLFKQKQSSDDEETLFSDNASQSLLL